MEITEKIIHALPYGKDFCFVDSIDSIDENVIKGSYTFTKDLFFYNSHFKGNPLVPGVIMIETMGQIGMVCHLIYLTGDFSFNFLPVLCNVETNFFCNANYNEKVVVTGKKIYFRNNILKSSVEMCKSNGSLIASLTANILVTKNNEG